MDIFKGAERLMGMDDAAWARHANPWSGWTRAANAPLIVLAIWSRTWLGWWALVPLGLCILWMFLNPRAFAPPRDYDEWMSRGTLGERIWLDRANRDIPRHHRTAANISTLISALGIVPLAYGLWVLDAGWTLAGFALSLGGKMWFIDRMVWLHADLSGSTPGTPLPKPILDKGDRA
ncbi:DUF6653 family protein [Pontivivens ytuae]|uniref:Uncharacterized protein n=1 Tax=Pontivivens ytuae TaxID=2789856 RepID=A0A7S9QCC4_9RHOB|nr:DUF6653 family protein [Pontivivens ytuae]QPH53675.1 hypothetical protein I0K15_18130 [Pontivivens ytuae]